MEGGKQRGGREAGREGGREKGRRKRWREKGKRKEEGREGRRESVMYRNEGGTRRWGEGKECNQEHDNLGKVWIMIIFKITK